VLYRQDSKNPRNFVLLLVIANVGRRTVNRRPEHARIVRQALSCRPPIVTPSPDLARFSAI
jgi:hypothetical protein